MSSLDNDLDKGRLFVSSFSSSLYLMLVQVGP